MMRREMRKKILAIHHVVICFVNGVIISAVYSGAMDMSKIESGINNEKK